MSIFNSVDIISGSLNIYRDGTDFASQSAYIIRQGIETTGGIKGDTLSITTTNPPTASGGIPIPLLTMGYSDTSEAPRVGIGTSSPKTLFQIESPSSSLEAPDIILTIPSESVSVGDETGRIAFNIADTAFSSSGIVASGSTAAIYSKVLGTGVGGSYGSLVFEINDNIATTEPIKGMELGYGIVDYSGVGLAISGNVDISTGAPLLYLRNTGTGYPVMKLGYNSPTDFSDGELLIFTQGTASVKLSADSSPEDNSFIYYGNLGLGTYTPSEKLEIVGNTLISGSLNATSSFTASGLNYPDTDGLDRQVLKTDGNGNLSFGYSENVEITVKNVSGGSIPKGTPCYVTGSGTSGNIAGIIPADASNFSLMPAGIIAGETIADEAEGVGLINGFIQGVDTSDFSSGDTVYVAVGGGYTNIKPTGSGVYIQKLGNVEKVDAVNGSGVINGPGYYNDLPNWEEGKIMVGTTTYPATSSFININETNSTLIVDGTILGSGGAQLNLEAYEFGYEITTSFPVTGSGLIVSSSNLPANHYNMVKIGETELLDINSALTPNTFFIHNVDTIVVASGSEPVNVYGDGPGKLFEHNSSEFKVYSDDGLKLTVSSGSSTFNHPISTNQILTAATSASSPQYVAVWEGSPSGVPTALKYTTASAFTGGGGGSSPYSLGTFGGRYNWSSTESDVRIAHGYTNGPIAGATANDDNFGPYLDTHTIDSTTETFNTYKMQYYAIYSPVAGVPHIKAWGRSSDTDFATNGCEIGVSVWSVDTEPSDGATSTQTATLRATSPTFTVPNSTIGYFGNGMEASGSSSRPAGSFYLVTFDLSGSLAATATLYMNFHLWIE